MGDPRRARKSYTTPNHPWNKARIDDERKLRQEFGLRTKRELYIMESFLKKYKKIAKKLFAATGDQAAKEEQQVLGKLQRLGLLPVGAPLSDVLSLEVKDVLNRRLQSVLNRKGLARSMKQARQFITHRHVAIAGKEITAPSYLVSLEEESQITFKDQSALASEDHPERADVQAQKELHAEAEAVRPKATETAAEVEKAPANAEEAQ